MFVQPGKFKGLPLPQSLVITGGNLSYLLGKAGTKGVMGRVKKALILRWKLLNPPQNLLKILPMITGGLHRLHTPPFSLSGRLSHFRAFSQSFDTGFSRLSPFSPFPSHHFPPALYARSIIPISRFSLVSRTQEFPNPHLDLETPVEEAVQRGPHCLTNVS